MNKFNISVVALILACMLMGEQVTGQVVCNKESPLFQSRNRQKLDSLGLWKHIVDIYPLSAQTGHFEYAQTVTYHEDHRYDEASCQFVETQYWNLTVGVTAIQEVDIKILGLAQNSLRDIQRYSPIFTTPPIPGGADLSADQGLSLQMNKRAVAVSFLNSQGDITLQEDIVNTVPGFKREIHISSYARIPIDAQGNTINKCVALIRMDCNKIQNLNDLPQEIVAARAAWAANEVVIDPTFNSYIFYYVPSP